MTDHPDQWGLDVIPPLGLGHNHVVRQPARTRAGGRDQWRFALSRHDESHRRRYGRRRDIAARAVLSSRLDLIGEKASACWP